MFDFNRKKGALLFLAQAWILTAEGLNHERSAFAVSVLAGILALDEKEIPDDVEQACKDLMWYQDGRSKERPTWYNPPNKGGDEFYVHTYPWQEKKG